MLRFPWIPGDTVTSDMGLLIIDSSVMDMNSATVPKSSVFGPYNPGTYPDCVAFYL